MRPEGNGGVSGRSFFLFLAAYLILHVVIRVVVSGNAELDEAEQIVWGQAFSLGYGAELPLYTWLQAIFFSLFGTNIIAVSLLRSLLLFLIYLLTYLSAREITGSERCGVAAASSLLLIPLISWESQRILTHMVLAVALAAISIFLFIRLIRTGRVIYYLLFGLSSGLGMLTKYNFGIFLAALIVAAYSNRTLRSALANRRTIAALAVFLLVTSPPFFWIISHPAAAMAKAGKLHPTAGVGLFRGYLAGFGELAKAVAGFHLLLVAVFIAIFTKGTGKEDASGQDRELRNLIGWTVLTGLFICALLVLFFHVTHFKSRWLLPVLFPAPLFLTALVQERLGSGQLRKLTICAGIVAVVVLTAMPGRIVMASYLGSQGRMNFPYDRLARELSSAGFDKGIIVAETPLLGGNLRLRFPQEIVTVPGRETVSLDQHARYLFVWDATDSNKVPESISSLANSLELHGEGIVRYVTADSLFIPGRKSRLGFILAGGDIPHGNSATEPGNK